MTEVREAVVPRERHPLRVAMVDRDVPAAVATLADDVVFWSPTATKPFVGKAQVAELIEVLIRQFEGFEYLEEWAFGSTEVVRFRGRLGGWPIEGIEIQRQDAEGKVREVRVMMRPLSGVAGVAKAIGPELARRRGGVVKPLVLVVLTHFTPRILAVGERVADRFYRRRA